LRSGRLDKHIYLPPPDFEARKLMFELFSKKRPTEIGLNYDELAKATSMEHWGKANPVRTGFFD